MFIKRYGQGERVFFGLHGWSGTHRTFEPLVPFLPPDATLYAVDLPGSGRSPRLASLDQESLSRAIAEAVNGLDADAITFIGNCSGAIQGLAALPAFAARVERLVLIDPFAFTPWYFRLFVLPVFGRYAYYSTFANPLGRWIANLSLKRHRTEETDLTESFGRIDHASVYRYLELLTQIDGIDQFAWIRHPIDIVHGERTFGAVRVSIERWKRIWPQARTFELAGAGHLPILEATEQLSRIIFNP
ncbi:MAG: alpha/beta fold hydrolase [Blastocatellia bacterium]|nr:alpha/beta fold hydrolase [Blastocatellia bacterium]